MPHYKNIKLIIAHNQDIRKTEDEQMIDDSYTIIRGSSYYGGATMNRDTYDRDQIERLIENEYIERHENLIIVGPIRSGKSYIACALGVEACNATLKVMYIRLPDLLAELNLAKVQKNYIKRINQYIKCDLLILDERLLIGTNNAEQQDILEILEKRYRIHSQYSASV